MQKPVDTIPMLNEQEKQFYNFIAILFANLIFNKGL